MHLRYTKQFLSLALIFGLMTPVIAQETWNLSAEKTDEPPAQIRYDFDAVKVVYGLNFKADPQNVSPDSWISQLAGSEKKIDVLFGAVYFYKDGQHVGKEHFLKVTGANGSRRFLENSMKNIFKNPGDSAPETIAQFFWSAKQLDGNTIVKNFDPPVVSSTLWRSQNPEGPGGVTQLKLAFSNDGKAANEAFWGDGIQENEYLGLMDTVNEWTDPCTSTGDCLVQ